MQLTFLSDFGHDVIPLIPRIILSVCV